MITITEIRDGNLEGIRVTISSIEGNYTFTSAFAEGDGERVGRSTPVSLNGNYILPWHVSAALGANGLSLNPEGSWIEQNRENLKLVISEIKEMVKVYQEAPHWWEVVKYANKLTGEVVY